MIGQPYVNQAALGDFDAYGGIPQLNNPNNHVGYSSRVSFVVNMGADEAMVEFDGLLKALNL